MDTLAESIGIRLTATNHEASSEMVIVAATWPRKMLIWLTSPNRFGTNTMMLVKVPALIASCTLRVPSMAHRYGSFGYFSRYW